ncbi:MAG: dihydroorotase, multifunctional complex type [Phycisphaerales bacterium]|nr:dihydroorotase, multifunctional complex type [Phycisphaerales bacterium]
MPSILIKNGTILDPSRVFELRADVLIRDGKIAAVGTNLGDADQVIDATGKYVTPGLIDIHVHFREPGDEEEETVASGAATAVAGGFTTVCCMPNTKPALDNEGQIELIIRQAQRANLANVLPIGAITKGREGKELAEIGSMLQRGAIAFSDDGVGVADASVMRKALQYCKMFDTVIMQHCEEPTLSGGAMHAGVVSAGLGVPGIPAEAEQLMIARDVLLDRTIGCRYHVQHISTAGSVELIRRAKHDGLPVTAEVAPHHLLLTDEMCRTFDTNYKMNPPLRTAADVKACIAGVKDGTIDILATDHAPHLAEEKELEFVYAPFGIIGLECALPLYVKALVEPGHITWMQLIGMMTAKPADIVKLDKGTLQEGKDADVTIIDPHHKWTIDCAKFHSKSRNCPFTGWEVGCRAVMTIVGGEVKWSLEGGILHRNT